MKTIILIILTLFIAGCSKITFEEIDARPFLKPGSDTGGAIVKTLIAKNVKDCMDYEFKSLSKDVNKFDIVWVVCHDYDKNTGTSYIAWPTIKDLKEVTTEADILKYL